MKLKNFLLVAGDMERSKRFYKEILGLEVVMDFGANITLTGGLCLQSRDSWMEFINADSDDIVFGGNNAEIYFEEDNFDQFLEKLKDIDCIQLVHPVIEHRWGQRVIRFYDPDQHIIEVGENLKAVCKRFLDSEMTVEEVAKRMDLPLQFVNECNG